jgi:hypothetical protein
MAWKPSWPIVRTQLEDNFYAFTTTNPRTGSARHSYFLKAKRGGNVGGIQHQLFTHAPEMSKITERLMPNKSNIQTTIPISAEEKPGMLEGAIESLERKFKVHAADCSWLNDTVPASDDSTGIAELTLIKATFVDSTQSVLEPKV